LMCKMEWNTALTMPLISDADVSVPAFEPEENILNIPCGWHSLVKTLLIIIN